MESTESAPDAKLGEEPVAIQVDELAYDSSSSVGSQSSSKGIDELAQEQKQWHEERIRRRLQSDYEKAGRALSAMVCQYYVMLLLFSNLLTLTTFDTFLRYYVYQYFQLTIGWFAGRRELGCSNAIKCNSNSWCKSHQIWLLISCRIALPSASNTNFFIFSFCILHILPSLPIPADHFFFFFFLFDINITIR